MVTVIMANGNLTAPALIRDVAHRVVIADALCRTRIRYGVDQEDVYPFMVLLKIEYGQQKTICGGALIKTDWVLTSANCVIENPRDNNPVALSQITPYLDKYKKQEGYTVGVKRVIVHDKFNNPRYFDNDIALLQLNENISDDYGVPVRLADKQAADKYEGQQALIMGWGLADNYTYSPVLLEGMTRLIGDDECDINRGGKVSNGDGKLCSAATGKEARPSTGDEGGPLVMEVDSEMVHIGLISHSQYIRKSGGVVAYTSYTDTGAYYWWIQNNIEAVSG